MDITYWIVAIVLAAIVFRAVVKRRERGPELRRRTPLTSRATDAEIELLVAEGRKIEAIKAYRTRHGVGLEEAKDAVEEMARHAAREG
ncbi:MAG: ribosomal protein L7/L12 [Deltaproteobacteria bacterium]|nr:MAG: ribosomal protein L7/L12 [Deltaproteobacteria bacterium]